MNGDLIGAVVRLLVALPLILGIAYLVLKYGLARRYVVTTGNRRMKLVEQLPLGPKTSLSLVSLGGKYYLLAHQDNSVSLETRGSRYHRRAAWLLQREVPASAE